MSHEELEKWLADFKKAMINIQIEYDAFFQQRNIADYCTLKRNDEQGYFSVSIERRDELPVEIIDRITVAYLETKPR